MIDMFRDVHCRLLTVWRRLAESELVYFLRLLRIARRGDPQATYLATLAWLDSAWRADERGVGPHHPQ
jgi:hypothetical protein